MVRAHMKDCRRLLRASRAERPVARDRVSIVPSSMLLGTGMREVGEIAVYWLSLRKEGIRIAPIPNAFGVVTPFSPRRRLRWSLVNWEETLPTFYCCLRRESIDMR